MAARVSIVVRSMGRPELHDALASLAAQTWPEVEVVLVAACGPGHPAPPQICGPHEIVFVPGDAPRSRPVAANAGLGAATGAFVGLLDDDDLYLPAHIETLVAALVAAPLCPAAYSIVREVDAAGRALRHPRATVLASAALSGLLHRARFPFVPARGNAPVPVRRAAGDLRGLGLLAPACGAWGLRLRPD